MIGAEKKVEGIGSGQRGREMARALGRGRPEAYRPAVGIGSVNGMSKYGPEQDLAPYLTCLPLRKSYVRDLVTTGV